MARYRIHRMKDASRENFRWAAHTGGLAIVKPKDYDSSGEVEAPTAYAAWKALAMESRSLGPGDLLESIGIGDAPGDLLVAKYIGFEPAQWFVPELKSGCAIPSSDSPESADSNAHSLPG